jgi:hypothetical protein
MKAKASRKMGVQAPFPRNTAYILRFVNKIQEHMAAQPLLPPPPSIHFRFQAPHEGKGQQEDGCASHLPPKHSVYTTICKQDPRTHGCPATANPPSIHLRFQAPHEGKGQQENGCG